MAAPGTPNASRTPSLSSTRTAACIAVIFAIAASFLRRSKPKSRLGRRPTRCQAAFPRCGKRIHFCFACRGLGVSTKGGADRFRRLAHKRAERSDALVGQPHGGTRERDGAGRLAMLVGHRGGNAAQP